MSGLSKRKVAYLYDPDVGAYSYGFSHLMKPHRMRMTHELAMAYGMLEKMHVLKPKRASPEAMTTFHTDEYIHFLSSVTPETIDKMQYQKARFLVGEDNPVFEGVFEFCSISAGGSIAASEQISSGAADIAINWAGGLHHAKKREAAGFCYINDIVLGILELLRTYPRVLYIDIDCHHGDGVEEAFYTSDRVMTCSFHKFGEFFPGTGTQDDRGHGKGKGYSVNVPLKDGMNDASFKSLYDPIISKILEVFQPSVVVLQCGADSLAGDKLGCLNLSMKGHAYAVQFFRKRNIPLIILGGGGYTVKNVARAWTYETACAIGMEHEMDLNMPWNQYFEWFGPTYRLDVLESNMVDENVKDNTLDLLREVALAQLQELDGPPSVQMQDVPLESVGRHLGFKRERRDVRDELDERLAQHSRYLYNFQDNESTDTEESDSSDTDESTSTVNTWRRGPYRASSVSRINGRHTRHQSPFISASERKRMSIVTGKYYDIPIQENGFGHYDCGTPSTKGTKRKFFQSVLEWDDVSVVDASVNLRTDILNELGFSSIHGLSSAIERGAQDLDEDVEDVVEGDGVDDEDQEEDQEEDEDEVEMSVDS